LAGEVGYRFAVDAGGVRVIRRSGGCWLISADEHWFGGDQPGTS